MTRNKIVFLIYFCIALAFDQKTRRKTVTIPLNQHVASVLSLSLCEYRISSNKRPCRLFQISCLPVSSSIKKIVELCKIYCRLGNKSSHLVLNHGSVEIEECGVWKMGSVENAEYGKHQKKITNQK